MSSKSEWPMHHWCGVVGSIDVSFRPAHNSITSPSPVLLNALVIKALKGRLRLRTYNNILLACLAVNYVLTGHFGQPSYVLLRLFLMFGLSSSDIVENLPSPCNDFICEYFMSSSKVVYFRQAHSDQVYNALFKRQDCHQFSILSDFSFLKFWLPFVSSFFIFIERNA